MKETKIEALQEVIDPLQEKLNDQSRRLDVVFENHVEPYQSA
jgi:hypothetical protein